MSRSKIGSRDDIPPKKPILRFIIVNLNQVKPGDEWTKAIFETLHLKYLPLKGLKERFSDFHIEFVQKIYDN